MGAPRQLRTAGALEDFEQELVDQYLLASVGAGVGDSTVSGDRAVFFEFLRYLGRPAWAARPEDADRFLAYQRKECGWCARIPLARALHDLATAARSPICRRSEPTASSQTTLRSWDL
jgi:hypothetical protein